MGCVAGAGWPDVPMGWVAACGVDGLAAEVVAVAAGLVDLIGRLNWWVDCGFVTRQVRRAARVTPGCAAPSVSVAVSDLAPVSRIDLLSAPATSLL